ncbi:MAG TPA: tetratricopeptide repeat protein [Stellaceae bacterium]|nr:tetratricopeptide repeat protein [Stellaceae bacterium]
MWLQCGHALRAAGKVSEAEAAYRKALDLDAENAEIRQKLDDVLRLRQSNEPADSLACGKSGAGVGAT